ncbi:DUF4179 domain-containing protein [Clostridium kluyveri]|uniref:DUF4179 domain-containing protein n=1 Tax=Clostridium kluyveri TaxID=1534 RepID=UPI00241E2DB6|nr:DUF4179 domain-containing protein [Clostridium kluyveri]
MKKKLSVKKKAAVAASIIFLISSSIIAVKPALANGIPIIGNILNKDLVSVNKQYKNYIDSIGKTKSDKGIDITFESAIADDNELFLNFIVRNNNKEIKNEYMEALGIPTSLKVNGERLNTGAGASWEFIDNNTIRVLKKIDWSQYKKKDKMNIDIDIDELYGKKGNWGVRFFVDKSNLVQKTVQYKVNKKIEINGREGKIDTVTVSPLTVSIKGTENFSKHSGGQFLNFIALDDKGYGLLWDGSSCSDSGNTNPSDWTTNFINTENSKSVTIIPVYTTKQESKKLPDVKLDVNAAARPLVLTIDTDRSIKIKDYFIEGDYLVVKYAQQYNGKEGLNNYIDMPIYLIADGTEIKEYTVGDKAIELWRKYDNDNQPIHVYKIGKARDIRIGTYDGSDLMIMKDKSITVKTK